MLLSGGDIAETEDADVEFFIGASVTGAGRGAARLVGLANERKTAFAFCLPVEEDAAPVSSDLTWGVSLSSCSDFLRFGGLGLADSSGPS